MQKTLVVITAILLISGISHATDTTEFGVDSYVPERFVDLEWRLNGHFRFQGADREDVTVSRAGRNESTFRSGSITSQLRYQWYTPAQFVNLSLGLNGQLDYQHYENNSTEPYAGFNRVSSSRSSEHQSYLSGAPKFEFGRYVAGDFFLGLSGEGLFSRSQTRLHGERRDELFDQEGVVDSYVSSTRRERIDSRVYLSGGSIVGWGRVYSGAFAATIEEVVRDLERSGLLIKRPSRAEYMTLCDTIYSFRKRHYFDERQNRIAAIKSIADQLVQMGVIGQDVLPALLINDVWSYYPRAERQFGWRVYGGPVGIWDWNRRSSYYDVSSDLYSHQWSESSKGSWGFRGTAEYFRPVSLRLQLDAAFDLFLVSEDWRMRRTAKHYEGYRGIADLKYYFDSRTSGLIHVAFLQNPTPLDGLPVRRPTVYGGYDTWGANANQTYRATELTCEFRHRLSPPTTMSITVQQYWTTLDDDNSIGRIESSGYTVALNFTHWLY